MLQGRLLYPTVNEGDVPESQQQATMQVVNISRPALALYMPRHAQKRELSDLSERGVHRVQGQGKWLLVRQPCIATRTIEPSNNRAVSTGSRTMLCGRVLSCTRQNSKDKCERINNGNRCKWIR
tara:strand:+ start:314 stop:685 length:372 start_codon:yes stop_codon:yes gene_type:complete